MRGKFMASALVAVAMISILAQARGLTPAEPHAANAMWIEPSNVDLGRATIGYTFNITVWANCSVECAGWQFWLVYANASIKAVRAGYTAGNKSEFFQNTTSISVTPSFRSHNATHGRIDYGEAWIPSGPYVSPSCGSLAWVEFNVTSLPTSPQNVLLEFLAYTGSIRGTYLIEGPTSKKVDLSVYSCLVSLVAFWQVENTMWFEPSEVSLNVSEISPGYRFNVTVWASCTVECSAWVYSIWFESAYINAIRAGYTAGSRSAFFQNITTNSTTPVFEYANATHKKTLFGELWGRTGPYRGSGYGSLAWIEFNVTSLPSSSRVTTLDFYGYAGSNRTTYLLDSAGREVDLNVSSCSVKFLVFQQQAVNAMWFEPSHVDLRTSIISIGYRFNVTIWATCSVICGGWQFWLVYESAYFNATRTGYTLPDGLKSEFFQNISTIPVNPMLRTVNATHSRVEYGESWGGTGDKRSPGFGSLAWVEFEVSSLPTNSCEVTLEFSEYRSATPRTYLIDGSTSQKVNLGITSCTVEFVVFEQSTNNMWFEPSQIDLSTSKISISYRFNVTVWASCSVDCLGWQFSLVYETAYLNATRAGYTAGNRSDFFRNITAIPVSPIFDSFNGTHNRVLHSETWFSGSFRSPGFGSLAWVEFEVVDVPLASCDVVIDFFGYAGFSRSTFLLNSTRNEVNLSVSPCVVKLLVFQRLVNSIWFEPSQIDLNNTAISTGYRFNVTIWASCTVACGGWQFWLLYENAYINATRAGYTHPDGFRSEFFQNISTIPVTPQFKLHNSTHSRIEYGESWGGTGPQRDPGHGSLAWIEFEVFCFPINSSDVIMGFYGYTGSTRRTYLIDAVTSQKPDLECYTCLVKLGPVRHDANALWFDPSIVNLDAMQIYPGYKFNVTMWTNCSVECIAWQCWIYYESAYINATRAGYTAGSTSQFFQNITATDTIPVLEIADTTHNRVILSETWTGAGERKSPGYGSLAWIEFSVTSVPTIAKDVTIAFYGFSGLNLTRYTYLYDATLQMIDLNASLCLVRSPQIQNQIGTMFLGQSQIELDRSVIPVGYRFNVTVSANCSFPCGAWQFWLVCQSGYIVARRAGYTAGGKSEFFQNITTVPLSPIITQNGTHERVEFGESWAGSGAYRSIGSGSLAWVEFEVTGFPVNSYNVVIGFDAFTGANPRTYMISGTTGQKVSLTCNTCTIKLLVIPSQAMLDMVAAFGGSTNPFQGTYTYSVNQVVSVQAWADIGYAFDHWVFDGIDWGAANPLQVTMDTNHTLEAAFIKVQPVSPQPTPYVTYDYGPIIFALTTFFILIPLGLGVRSAMLKRKRPTTLPGYAPPPTPPPTQPTPMRRGWNECPRCGYVNMPNYNFCGKCGMPLTDRDENTQIY